MGAAAAAPIVARHGTDRIRTVVFATESSIDQSKSAGIYVHSLLGLPSATRVVELKQACYGATAGLQFAIGLVHRDPAAAGPGDRERRLQVRAGQPGRADPGRGRGGHAGRRRPRAGAHRGAVGPVHRGHHGLLAAQLPSTALVDGQESITAYLQASRAPGRTTPSRAGARSRSSPRSATTSRSRRWPYKAHRHLLDYCGKDANDDADRARHRADHGLQHRHRQQLHRVGVPRPGRAARPRRRPDRPARSACSATGPAASPSSSPGTVVARVPGAPAHRGEPRGDRPAHAGRLRRATASCTSGPSRADGGDHARRRRPAAPSGWPRCRGHKRIYQPR